MADVTLHCWHGHADEKLPPFRFQFESIVSGEKFDFDITFESLRKMLMGMADFANESEPGGYAQFAFDLTEEGE